MTPEQHKQRHIELHKSLDELVADWLIHNREAKPTTNTVMDLIQWSHAQTLEPSMP